MTDLYPRGQPAVSSLLYDLGLGWRHSAVAETDFVAPWEASCRALDLSFELGTIESLGRLTIPLAPIAPQIPTASLSKPSRTVFFNGTIEVLIGHDDGLDMCSTSLSHHDLCRVEQKPWGWFRSPDIWDYDVEFDCYKPHRVWRSIGFAGQLPFGQLRISDAWHSPLPPEALRNAAGLGGDDAADPDVIPDPALAPVFVRDLMDLADRHGYFTDPDGMGHMRVRTWYLHHQHERRSLHPRFLEFEEDWRRWETDFGLAWRDHILPNEEIRQMCTAMYGWQHIPFTMAPQHHVEAGHGFVITVRDASLAIGPSCSSSVPVASPEIAQQDMDYSPEPDDMYDPDEFPENDDEPNGHGDDASLSSSLHSGDLGVLVYRLNVAEAHAFAQGDTYVAIFNAAVRASQLPRSQGDRCQVFCNHQPWLLTDRRVRPLPHGTYLRIIVPPPLDDQLDTEVAICIARDFAVDVEDVQTPHIGRSGHGSSFRQIAVTKTAACVSDGPSAMCLKTDPAADPDLPLPSLTSLGPAPRPSASSGPGSFATGDRQKLLNLLRREQLIECEEEGPVMYLSTWYIHHQAYTRCYEERPVRLTGDDSTWIEDIVAPWLDFVDRSIPFVIRIVKPKPPCSVFECVQAHLIIEQSERPHHVTCLISIGSDFDAMTRWEHRAFSAPVLLNAHSVLQLTELFMACQRSTCSITLRNLPFALIDMEEIDPATNLVIRRLDEVPSDPESLSLLQSEATGCFRTLGVDLPGFGSEAAAFGFARGRGALNPDEPALWDQPSDIQALHALWTQSAGAWEDEDPAATFMVWYLCPGNGVRRCPYGRRVTLFTDFTTWRDRLIFAWRDLVLPHVYVNLHVVAPTTPPQDHLIAAHIILTQLMGDRDAGVLLSIADDAIEPHVTFQQCVVVPNPAQVPMIIDAVGYGAEQGTFVLQRDHLMLQPDQWFPTRTGFAFLLTVQRPSQLPVDWNPPFLPELPGAAGLGLLQTKATLLAKHDCTGACLTHGAVAQARGPPSAISFEDHCVEPHFPFALSLEESLTKVVRLTAGCSSLHLPDFVEVPLLAASEQIPAELLCWGHHCQVHLWGSHDRAFCVPLDWSPAATQWHVMFAHEDVRVGSGTFLHTFREAWTEHQLMHILYQLGFEKAFIIHTTSLLSRLSLVIFGESHGTIASQPVKPKPMRPWPPAQGRAAAGPLFRPCPDEVPDCLLRLGASTEDLCQFFDPHAGPLALTFDGIELPEISQVALTHLAASRPLSEYDRLVIYVDGSSQPSQKHLPPLRLDLEGVPDAWAFLVLGEVYLPDGSSELSLVGWQSQQVRYDDDSPYYAGALKASSHIAEREGMFFAALWRAGQNVRTPTIFRSDSDLTCRQATGDVGAAVIDFSFSLLRGIFQLLETALDPSHLGIEHIYGHNADPWNEAVDHLAKCEAQHSQFLPRQKIDLRRWGSIIPHLWLLFGEQFGCPRFCGHGFSVPPPALPPVAPDAASASSPDLERPPSVMIQFTLSIASANVSTLGVGKHGHAGKLDYVKGQFMQHCLTFLGVQEARTTEGSVRTDQLLRLCSGGQGKQLGVELWCNLCQPCGHVGSRALYFQARDFQVLQRDPRRLIVRVQNDFWRGLIFVGHAPHSGFSLSERTSWWDETSRLLHQFVDNDNLLATLDANASPGDPDQRVVFRPGLGVSSGTPLLRQFLEDFALCLPSTSHLHQGCDSTWTAPDGSMKCLIDFVAIPQSLLSKCTWSQTLEDFDLNVAHDDHLAVGLELTWPLSGPTASSAKPLPAACFDRSRIGTSSLSGSLASNAVPSWDVDIETHVNSLTDAFLQPLMKLCPKPKRAPKKPFMTSDLWQLRRNKLGQRRRLTQLHRVYAREALARVFLCWRLHQVQAPDAQTHCELSFNYGCSLRCAGLKLAAGLFGTCIDLKRGLQKAKLSVLAQHLDTLDTLTSASDVLRDALNRWIDFFMTMEGGRRVDSQEQRELWLANLCRLSVSKVDLSVHEVPSLAELEAAFRRVKPGKASGPDGLPSELFHYFPAVLTKQCYSTLLKVAIQGQECLIHKGGTLMPLWKGKGDMSICSSFRSILLSSHFGKTLHRALRLKQADVYEAYLHRQQLGGRRYTPVSLGTHYARAFMRWHKQRGRPTALLFLDLAEAFYRVVRPLALSGTISDEVISAMAARLGLDDNVVHELHQLLLAPSAVEDANLPHHAQRAIRAIHCDTHFSLRDQSDRCVTTLGSRPGDAYADVVFGYLWAKILHKLHDALSLHDLQELIPGDLGPAWFGSTVEAADTNIEFLGPCWCDDLCVCMSADSLPLLQQKVSHISGLLLDLCRVHGMTPNVQKGKTELMISVRGKGSRAFKQQWFCPGAPQGFPVLCETGFFEIPLVSSYKHLGGVLHHSGDLKQEVRRRLAMAHQAFTQHRKLLFHNLQIPLKKRAELLRCLVLSKFLYATDSWVLADQRTQGVVHAGIMRLYKRLLKIRPDSRLTDEEILAEVALPSPGELLRASRLRYVGTLFRIGGHVHWGLLNADSAWRFLIEEDFLWMHRQLWNSSPLLDPKHHLAQWLDIIEWHRPYWKRLIRRALTHASLQRTNEFHLRRAHHDILDALRAGGVHVPRPVRQRQPGGEVFGCMHCKMMCRNRAGEAAHMFKSHGFVHPVRNLFRDTSCAICLKEYHTAGKLKMHLIRSSSCRQRWHALREPSAPVPVLGSVVDEVRARAHDGLAPPLQAEGPSRPLDRCSDFELFDSHLFEQIALHIADSADLADLRDQLVADICGAFVSWTCCRLTLEELLHTLQAEGEALGLLPLDAVLGVLSDLLSPQAWPFLLDEFESPVEHFTHLTQIEATLCDVRWHAETFQIPRMWGKHRIVLHAFAGRRRPGDFQFYLDRLLETCEQGIFVHAVSMDILYDSHLGDASNVHTQEYWYWGISRRWVVGFLGGPPCETWSKARGVAIDDHRAPRVLRSANELWGFEALSIRELFQVQIGNSLLMFALACIFRLALHGGVAVLEHPAEPPDATAASIWKLPIVILLSLMPGVEILEIFQGYFGAPTPKPTSLLCLNLPDLGAVLHSHMICEFLPQRSAIGKQTDGSWATAKLKEYPPGLCFALAHGFYRQLSSTLPDKCAESAKGFLNSCQPLLVIAGPPAAGKGTQCEKIKDKYGFVHISTGDILRENVKKGTELGKKAKGFMDSGALVPSELIVDLVKDRLMQDDVKEKGCLLDGFPRAPDQAQAMVDAGLDVEKFLVIKVPDDTLVERGCGRRLDPETGEIYHLKFRRS
eukprot:s5384_g2.t1